MKILFITNKTDGSDGWSRYSKDVINAVSGLGNEVLVLEDDQKRTFLDEPIKYINNPWRAKVLAHHIDKLARDFQPDAIHFLVEPYAYAAGMLKSKAKKVLTIHGTYSYIPNLIGNPIKKVISKWLFKKMYLHLNKLIAVSDYTAAYLKASIDKDFSKKLDTSKISIIHNGIDLNSFSEKKTFEKLVSAEKIILFMGAVKPRKGLMQSLKALLIYKNKYNAKVRFKIAGSFSEKGRYYNELKQFIYHNDLQSNVEFLGRVSEEEKLNLYSEADLFLMLPKREGNAFEGFGLVYLEANAFGVPTIGSLGCGAESAIKDGYSGLLANPEDAKAVAEKINTILSNSRNYNEGAKKWAEQHEIKKVAEKIVQQYN